MIDVAGRQIEGEERERERKKVRERKIVPSNVYYYYYKQAKPSLVPL